MKTVLWISFYFMAFLAMILGFYYGKDEVVEETKDVPVLNYTKYHTDAQVDDSTYTEKIDSLAVVVEGLLTELSEYVSQLQDRDSRLQEKESQIEKLKRENDKLKAMRAQQKEEKLKFNKAADEKKLQELSKMLGSMKSDVLAPVLKNLPDNLVQILYDKAKPRDRSLIFNALPPDRAGKILTRIAGNNQKE